MTTDNKRHFTGIGSLPHHNVDAALQYSFSHSLPFLPQIPLRNPWEYMLPQALEGLPGLLIEASGLPRLDLNVWSGRTKSFAERLKAAFASKDPYAFESFEPSSATSACYQPFLWELEEQNTPHAKIQIAGPMTSQWGLRADQATSDHVEIRSQVFQLILARAIGMCRRIKMMGKEVTLFIDEPALFSPQAKVAFSELGIFVKTLKQEGVHIGIHCCSDTHWDLLLATGLDILSLDTSLSFPRLLQSPKSVESFLDRGGKFALGLIPTHSKTHPLGTIKAGPLLEQFLNLPGLTQTLARRILASAWITPACGLALHSTVEAENALALLDELSRRINAYLT